MRPTMRNRVGEEQGSFIIEIVVSAMIVVLLAIGALSVLDRSSSLAGQQSIQAIATDIAQTEQEDLRAFAVADLSNLRRSFPKRVDNVDYTVNSRADWVTDSTGTPDCTSGEASYIKLKTTVTWPNMAGRKPAVLDTIVSPPARTFGENQGSLAVTVQDRNAVGVSGLGGTLSGPVNLSDTTSAAGCILWGYLPAVNGYTIGFSRSGWVNEQGVQAVALPTGVTGGTTKPITIPYDRAGSIRATFTTLRKANSDQGAAATLPTKPKKAVADIAQAGGINRPFDVNSDGDTRGDLTSLFPFTQAYSVYADTCGFAAPPAPAAATVTPGNRTDVTVPVPAMNIKVTSNGAAINSAIVKVTTRCSTIYDRRTTVNGWIDDPGFPYMPSTTAPNVSGLTVCVQAGGHRHQVPNVNEPRPIDPAVYGVPNTNFNGTELKLGLNLQHSGSPSPEDRYAVDGSC